MKKILALQLIIIALLVSCASVDYSNVGAVVNSDNSPTTPSYSKLGLKISAEEDESFASEYFGVINFSFVNNSQDWITIKNIKLDFGNDTINSNINIISGNDILAWKESTMLRNKIDEHNQNVFLGSLALSGALLSTSNNSDVKTAGNTMLLGSITSLSVKEIAEGADRIQYSTIFPANHLLNSNFTIPPGLFVKKWIVINTKNHNQTGIITKFDIEYQTSTLVTEKVRIVLNERLSKLDKDYISPPVWQKTYFNSIKNKVPKH